MHKLRRKTQLLKKIRGKNVLVRSVVQISCYTTVYGIFYINNTLRNAATKFLLQKLDGILYSNLKFFI